MNKIILLILLVIATNTVFANEKPNKNINKDSFTLISELKEVKELFDTGVIDEKEFKLIKQKLINNLYGLNLDSDNNSKTNESVVSTDDESLTSDEPKLKYWGKKYYQKAKEFYDNKDYENAYKWAKKSADKGYKGGYYGLGLAYEKGYGFVEKDNKKAIKYYKKASELGHRRAKTRLKRLISKGETIKKPPNRNSIANTKYSCVGDLWTFSPTGGSSNASENYWGYPEVINNVLSVPKFGEYVQPKKSGKIIWWIRTKGKERKDNWAKIDLSGGESLITKKDSYNIIQFKGKCSKKN